MNHRLLFATTNAGKLGELRELAGELALFSLNDVPRMPEVLEDEDTLAGNARQKARAAARGSGLWALADDSGLFVDALDGRPGVHSARYAEGDDAARIRKLLAEMTGVPEGKRWAQFRCALCLASPAGECWVEEGACEGEVLRVPRGTAGFGYDPVLWLPALGRSMAELSPAEKKRVSHRARAFAAMRPRLEAWSAHRTLDEVPRDPSAGG